MKTLLRSRVLAWVLTLAMVVTFMPTMSFAAGGTLNADSVTDLKNQIATAAGPDYVIQLTNDLSFFSEGVTEPITIDRNVTIDLNGCTISGAGAATNAAIIIESGGVLNLIDSSAGSGITSNATKRGGIWIKAGGTLNLENVAVSGNTPKGTDGIVGDIVDGGTLNINGAATIGTMFISSGKTVAFGESGSLNGETTVVTGNKTYPVTIATNAEGMENSFLSGNGDTAEVVLDGTDVKLAVPYDLTYDANAGEDTVENFPDPTTVKAFAGLKMPDLAAIPTREGYTFQGFNAKKEGNGYAFYEADGVGKERGAEGALTIYAKWDATKYSFQVAKGDSTPVPFGNNLTYADSLVINRLLINGSPLVPLEPGYTLVWNTKADFSGEKTFVDGETYQVKEIVPYADVESGPLNTVTLYAQYIPNEYSVHFDPNAPEGTTATGTMEDLTVTFDPEQKTALPANAYSIPGYQFMGWNLDKSDTVKYKDQQEVKNNLTGKKSITLYAVWAPIKYNVVLVKDGTADTPGIVVGQNMNSTFEFDLPEYTVKGYTTDYWYTKEGLAGTKFEAGTVKLADVVNAAAANGVSVVPEVDEEGNVAESVDIYLYGKKVSGNNYTIVFDKNAEDAEGTMEPQAFVYGTAQALTPNAFTREGYTFKGWATSADATTVKYNDGTVLTAYTTMEGAEVTLYALWEANTYRVTFNPNGGQLGEGSADGRNVVYGQAYGAFPPQFPTREGYKFMGWFTDPNAGERVMTDTIVTTPSDHDIYAHWGGDDYYVVYRANDGTTTQTNQKSTMGTVIQLLENTFTRANYVFDGWNTVAEPTEENPGVAYQPGDEVDGTAFNLEKDGAGSLIAKLFAQWKAVYYKVNIDAAVQNGTVEADKETANADETVTVTATPAEGYSLKEVTCVETPAEDAPEGTTPTSVTVTEVDGVYSFTMPGHDVTVSAKFEANKYLVTMHTGEGTFANGKNLHDRKIAYGDNYSFPATDPTREGYAFAGWYDNEAFEGEPITAETPMKRAENHDLYAKWDPIGYKVTVAEGIENGSVTPDKNTAGLGETVALTVAPDAPYTVKSVSYQEADKTPQTITPGEDGSYTFVMPANDVTVSAEFAPKEVTITFDPNGGTTTTKKNTYTYGKQYKSKGLPTPTWGGRTFTGWFTEKSGGEQIKGDDTVDRYEDFTVYAHWDTPVHNIVNSTKEDAHGTVDVKDSAELDEEVTATITPDTGYVLSTLIVRTKKADGQWDKQEYATNKVVDGKYTFTMPNADYLISATFAAKTTTVYFDKMNKGGVYGESNVSDKTITATYGQTLADRPVPSLAGYSFQGYFDAQEGGKQYYDGEGKALEGVTWDKEDAEVTLYAQWEIIGYKVTVAEGIENGSVTPDKKTACLGETVKLTVAPDAPYTVKSVSYQEADNAPQPITPAEDGSYAFEMPANDVTVSAEFAPKEITITFDPNGGETNTPTNSGYVYGKTYGYKGLPEATWDSEHSFLGWFTEKSGGDQITKDGTVDRYEDFTVYAHWSTKTYNIIDNTAKDVENPHGHIEGLKETAEFGEEITATIVPDEGFYLQALDVKPNGTTGQHVIDQVKDGKFTFKMGNSDYIIRATFAPIGYTVKFEANAPEGTKVTGTMADQNFEGGETKALTSNAFQITGYKFVNWKDDNGKTYEDAQEVTNLTTEQGATVTLQAQWEANKYTVNFDANAPAGTTATGTMAPQEFTFGEPQKLSKNQFAVEGYEFLGWQSGSGKDKAEPKYADEEEVTSLTSNASTTLYAIWAKLYNVTVEPAFGAKVTFTPESPMKAGETVTVTVEAAKGFELKDDALTATPAVELKKGADGTYTFKMPEDNVTLKANVQYQVKVAETKNGTVSVDKQKPEVGETVTITATADKGYAIDTITVTDSNKNEIPVGEGYTFKMPEANVKVTVTFAVLPDPVVEAAPETNTVPFGYTEGSEFTATVTNEDTSLYDYTYQWYEIIDGTEKAINDAADKAYAPMGKDAGTYTYFCEVTAKKKGSGEEAVGRSNEVTLKVETADPEITFTPTPRTYNGEEQVIMTVTVTPAASEVSITEKDGKGITVDDSKKDKGEYTVAARNAGSYTIKVELEENRPNYNSAIKTAEAVRIDPRIVEIEWKGVDGDANNFAFPYTGDPQGPTATVTNLAVPNDECTISVNGNDKVEVGNDYTAIAYAVSNTNYTILGAENTERPFTIVADTAEAPLEGKDLTYNGEAQPLVTVGELKGCTVQYKFNGQYTDEVPTAINAGTYKIEYKVDVQHGYDMPQAQRSGTLTTVINKADLNIQVKDAEVTYGASYKEALDVFGMEAVAPGLLGQDKGKALNDVMTGRGYDCEYKQFDNVGDYPIGGHYEDSANYNVEFLPGKLTVVQKEVGIEWANTEVDYNGEAQIPTATPTGLVNNDAVTITVEGAQKDAGEYTATAKALAGDKAGNYKLPAENTTPFKINKVKMVIEVKDATVTYGAARNEVSLGMEPVSGIVEADKDKNWETLVNGRDYVFDYQQFDPVGEYPINGKGTSTNYELEFQPGTLTVVPKEIEITWDENDELTYTGEEQTYAGAKINDGSILNNDDVTLVISGNKGTNVQEYTAEAALAGAAKDNYVIAEKDATHTWKIWKIKQADNAITELTISDWVYGQYDEAKNGPAVKAKFGQDTVVFKYVPVEGNNAVGEYKEGLPTDAGSYAVVAEIPETTNYKGASYGPVFFNIEKADNAIVTELSIEDWTYGDEPKQPTVEFTDGTPVIKYIEIEEPGDDGVLKPAAGAEYTTEVPTDAGNYAVYAEVPESKNYKKGTSGPVAFKINQAENELTVSIEGWTYGEEANAPEATAKFKAENEPTYQYKAKDAEEYSDAVPTNAGSYTVKASVAETKNYKAAEATADFEIAKAKIEPTVAIEGWTYGDTAKDPSVEGNSGNGAVTYKYKAKDAEEYSDAVPTNAGSYTVKAEIAETDNYLGGSATADFEIAPKALTVEMVSDIPAQTATGRQLTPEVTVKDGDTPLAKDTDYTVAYGPNISGSGTATVTGTGNYTGEVPKTFTINPSGGGGNSGGGGGGGGAVTTYTVTVEKTDNGSATASPTSAAAKATVTVTTTPAATYKVAEVTAKDAKGKAVTVKEGKDGKYTFTMPASNVTVTATFEKDPNADPSDDPNKGKDAINGFTQHFKDCPPEYPECPMKAFSDLTPSAWYHDGVHFCLENRIMQGYGGGIFKPDGNITRAELVTVLWNIAGKPVVDATVTFDDVKSGDWFYNAITWAAKHGIVNGYGGGKFGPNDHVTREQIAKILYGYAKFYGYDVSQTSDLNDKVDKNQISDWALPYVQWGCGAQICCGQNGDVSKIAPQGKATRAELATMIKNFCIKYAEK